MMQIRLACFACKKSYVSTENAPSDALKCPMCGGELHLISERPSEPEVLPRIVISPCNRQDRGASAPVKRKDDNTSNPSLSVLFLCSIVSIAFSVVVGLILMNNGLSFWKSTLVIAVVGAIVEGALLGIFQSFVQVADALDGYPWKGPAPEESQINELSETAKGERKALTTQDAKPLRYRALDGLRRIGTLEAARALEECVNYESKRNILFRDPTFLRLAKRHLQSLHGTLGIR